MLTSEQEADSEFIPRNHLDFANLLALHLVEKKLQAKHRGKIPPMLSFHSISLNEYCQQSYDSSSDSSEGSVPLTLPPVVIWEARAWYVSLSQTPESELEVQQNIRHSMRHVPSAIHHLKGISPG